MFDFAPWLIRLFCWCGTRGQVLRLWHCRSFRVQKDLKPVRIRLCGEPLELLSKRRLLVAGIFRLPHSHYVNHFDAGQYSAGTIHELEPHH
jgi:hypothetical protein